MTDGANWTAPELITCPHCLGSGKILAPQFPIYPTHTASAIAPNLTFWTRCPSCGNYHATSGPGATSCVPYKDFWRNPL